jgi:hypothetical protein
VGLGAKIGQAANAISRGVSTARAARAVNATVRAGAGAVVGADIGGVAKVAQNAIDGVPLSTNVLGAAIGGALGGASGAAFEGAVLGRAQRAANATGIFVGTSTGNVAAAGAANAFAQRAGTAAGAALETGTNSAIKATVCPKSGNRC